MWNIVYPCTEEDSRYNAPAIILDQLPSKQTIIIVMCRMEKTFSLSKPVEIGNNE